MGLFGKRLQGIKDTAAQLSALQEQAKVFQAAQGYGPDGQPLPAEARPQIDPASMVPPASEFVKRTSCAFCGAPKVLPSVREYLYCDYCGQLVDFDLRQAMASAYANPDSTAYAQQANQIGPAAAQAVQAGDRERYRQLQYQLYDLQATYTRWAVPPRAWNDEAYRTQWVRFSAERAAATAFDPAFARLDDDMRRLAIGLRWRGGNVLKMAMGAMGGGQSADAFPKVDPASLWPLIDVLVAQSARTEEVVAATGVQELDPDRMPPAVLRRMTPSSIAQGYLRFLEPDEGLELIRRLGISHEFVRPEIAGEQRACGGCGSTMSLAPGAACVVCDGCGRRVDVGAGELPCTGCGATMCLPEGVDQKGCPYCKAVVRRA